MSSPKETSKTFLFFMDPDSMSGIFDDWPDKMAIAIWVDVEEGFTISVCREEEMEQVIARHASENGIPVESLCVVPRLDGHPTASIKFSQEQMIMQQVAQNAELCEMAEDYSVNYQFAIDQGISPEYAAHPEEDVATETEVKPAKEVGHAISFARVGYQKPIDGNLLAHRRLVTKKGDDGNLLFGKGDGSTYELGADDFLIRDDYSGLFIPQDTLGPTFRFSNFTLKFSDADLHKMICDRFAEVDLVQTIDGLFISKGKASSSVQPPVQKGQVQRILPTVINFAFIFLLLVAGLWIVDPGTQGDEDKVSLENIDLQDAYMGKLRETIKENSVETD